MNQKRTLTQLPLEEMAERSEALPGQKQSDLPHRKTESLEAGQGSNQSEEWRPVVGYESLYEVSSNGRIRGAKYSKILRYNIMPKGYNLVSLSNNKARSGKSFKVARIVAKAFHPNPNNLPQVNHINGIKTDDRASNLEWISASGNLQHAWDNGLRKYSRRTTGYKLTQDQANQIRVDSKAGISNRILASRFGVSEALVIQIKQNKIWKTN